MMKTPSLQEESAFFEKKKRERGVPKSTTELRTQHACTQCVRKISLRKVQGEHNERAMEHAPSIAEKVGAIL